MIGREEILSMLEELLPQIEEDKSEEEIRHIIKRFLIEKGITQHLTENQIRAICWQYLSGNVSGDDSGGNGSSSVTPVTPAKRTYKFEHSNNKMGLSGYGPPSEEEEVNKYTYYFDTQNGDAYKYYPMGNKNWYTINRGNNFDDELWGYYDLFISISDGKVYQIVPYDDDTDQVEEVELDDDTFIWVDNLWRYKTNVVLLMNKEALSKVAEWGAFIHYLFYIGVEGISILELFMQQYDEPLYKELGEIYYRAY